jgi:hypothetical protein
MSLRQAFVSAELYESCGFSKTLVRILCAFRPGDSVAFQLSLTSAMIVRFRHGEVSDQVELPRLARVMQSRMTQIMNLLHLAPDIQESLLFPPRFESGRAPIHEKRLRSIAAEIDWSRQRKMWAGLESV